MAIAKARSDLPVRDGVGASRVFMPAGRWNCVIDFLHERFPYVGRLQWEERLAQGLVLELAQLESSEQVLHTQVAEVPVASAVARRLVDAIVRQYRVR